MPVRTSALLPLIILFLSLSALAAAQPILLLNKVELEGLTTLSASDLLKELELPSGQLFDPELSSDIRDRLLSILSRKGFHFATVNQTDIIPLDSVRVNLVFLVDEGFAGSLQEIRFSGNRYFSSDAIFRLLDLREGREFNLNRLPLLMDRLLSLYTSRGYLFAEVSLDSLLTGSEQLSAIIRIDEGTLFRAENYLFSGNKVTRNSTLLKISGLTQVKQITPEVLAQAEENVLRKPYIRDCSIVPLNGNTLGFEITETRMTRIEGVLGTATGPSSSRRRLNGFVNLQFLNLWGTDRAITLNWKSLSSSYRLLELAYHESGLTQYPVAADLMFQRTQQDSAWIRIKAELSAYYSYLGHKLGAGFSSENLYPDNPDSEVAVKTHYYNGSLFWEYARTDYAPNPTTGSQIKIRTGLTLNQTPEKSKSVPINEVDAVAYIPVAKRIVFALGLHFREISDKNARLYEQYKLGGFSTLRGYNEEAFSSWRIGWANSELRYLMSRDSRVFLLFDNGLLQTAPDKIRTDLLGIGAGISVQSRVGVISVSYALSIISGKLEAPGNGMLHVGLVSAF